MGFKLKVARSLVFPVKGEITLEDGSIGAFDFRLRAKRLDVDELKHKLTEAADLGEIVPPLVEGWYDVLDESGAEVPFSPEALTELFKVAGMSMVALQAYLASVKAREKN